MKIKKFVWLIPVILLVATGFALIHAGKLLTAADLEGYEAFASAEEALERNDFENAYSSYLQSAVELKDPQMKAKAICNAANIGWEEGISDYDSLVELYKQALRSDPQLIEAANNLELLYWYKENAPDMTPKPDSGDQPGMEEDTDGDI